MKNNAGERTDCKNCKSKKSVGWVPNGFFQCEKCGGVDKTLTRKNRDRKPRIMPGEYL